MTSSQSVADVIVVGAGIMGLMTAWELQKAGKKVLLLDKGEIGREASWAGGGILSQLLPWRYALPLQKLALDGQALYPALCEELHDISGIDPEWAQSGLLCVLDDAGLAQGLGWARINRVDHDVLSAEQLKASYPDLAVSEPGLLLKGVAQIRNPRLLRALAHALKIRGVDIHAQCFVRKLLIEKERVIGVQTSEGPMHAAHVVLASGAWTAELIPRDFTRPKIHPVKGQMLLYKAPQGLLEKIVFKDERYLIPRNDGRILAGSSMEDDGYNKSPTIDVKNEIRAFAESLLPALSEAKLEAHWTGLRPASPEGEPTTGRHPELDGLWLNAGHFRYGLTMAPASAQKLAAQLV